MATSRRSSIKLPPCPKVPFPSTNVCVKCLRQPESKSYANICLHEFCFKCLLSQSKIKPECVLCKEKFTSIIYNALSEREYDEVKIPIPEVENLTPLSIIEDKILENQNMPKVLHLTDRHSCTPLEPKFRAEVFPLRHSTGNMQAKIDPKQSSSSTGETNTDKKKQRDTRGTFVKSNTFRDVNAPQLDNDKIKKIIEQLLVNQAKLPAQKNECNIEQSNLMKQHSIIQSIDTPCATPYTTDNEAEFLVCNTTKTAKKRKNTSSAKSEKKKKRATSNPADIDNEQLIQQILAYQIKAHVAKKKSNRVGKYKTKKQFKIQSTIESPVSSKQDFDNEKLIQEILAEQTGFLSLTKKTKIKKKKKSTEKGHKSNSTEDEEQIIQEILSRIIKGTTKGKKSTKATKLKKKKEISRISLMDKPRTTSPTPSDTEAIITQILASTRANP